MASLADLALLLPIFAAGAGLIGYGLVALGQLIRLRRGSAIPSASATNSLVAFEGDAVGLDDATVTSPLTGRPALWYEYRVDGHGGDLTRPDWESLTEGRADHVFGVDTGSGTVCVDPVGADVAVDIADEVEVVVDPDDLSDVRSFAETVTVDDGAETVDVGVADLAVGERYRLVERRIEPGDTLAVTGSADVGATGGGDVLVGARDDRGRIARLLGVPLVVGTPGREGASGQLRARVLAGFVIGLPLVMLSLVYMFPP